MIRSTPGHRGVRWPGVALLVWTGLACGPRPEPPFPADSPFASPSISRYDAGLRWAVARGDSTALPRLEREAPADSVVRLLNRALYLHRFGRYEESNAALQEAERLSEDRYTKSITQNVAAFMVNDRVIDYSPPAHERAMLHYYGMLNYLALGDTENALVDARRANLFLDRYQRDAGSTRSYRNDALIQYLTGLLYASAGEDNDALVSLRDADRASADFGARYGIPAPAGLGLDLYRAARRVGVPEVAEAAVQRYGLADDTLPPPPDQGELVVLVENGYVAHRAEEKVYIPVTQREQELVATGEIDNILEATVGIMVRTVGWLNQASREGREQVREVEGVVLVGSLILDADLVTFAWPSYRLDAHAASSVTVHAGSEAADGVAASDLSAIAARDFEERKTGVLARMVARTLFKELAVHHAESQGEKVGGVIGGFLARIGARTAATLTERADLRSWSLLPSEIQLVRLTLPAGEHALSVAVRDGATARDRIDLGSVTVTPGQVTIHSVFVTGDQRGDAARFRAATREIDYPTPRVRR